LSDLILPEQRPFSGAASYYDIAPGRPVDDPRIHIRLKISEDRPEILAMVDTAAPWCILEPSLAGTAKDSLESLSGIAAIDSRPGPFPGKLYRGAVTVVAEEGETLTVDTTFFLARDWPGGNIVGYQGFLERFRFGVDPALNRFFFSSL